MRKLFLLIIALVVFQNVQCQDSARLQHERRMYKTIVTTVNPDNSTSGYLASISDSSIFVSSSYPVYATPQINTGYPRIDYSNIKKVTVRRKGGAGKGILIGSIAGLISGAIAAGVSYQEPKGDVERVVDALTGGRSTQMLAGGLLGGLSGGAIGAVIGAVARRTFTIGGNRDKFNRMRSKIIL